MASESKQLETEAKNCAMRWHVPCQLTTLKEIIVANNLIILLIVNSIIIN